MSGRPEHLRPPFAVDLSDMPHTVVVRDASGIAVFAICDPKARERAAAEFFVRAANAIPTAERALQAVRSDCRDPDTDTALAPATGELVEAALAAMEGRS